MAYLHEISNWRFFLKPGKRQQPVTPTQHSILSERPCSQSREANKNNNKEKKKKKQKVLKSDFTFHFAPPVFFRHAKRHQAGQKSAAGSFRAPFGGCTLGERSGVSQGEPDWSWVLPPEGAAAALSWPQPALLQAWVKTRIYKTPFHLRSALGAAASSPGAPGLAARLARRGGNPQPKQVLAYDFQPAH